MDYDLRLFTILMNDELRYSIHLHNSIPVNLIVLTSVLSLSLNLTSNYEIIDVRTRTGHGTDSSPGGNLTISRLVDLKISV